MKKIKIISIIVGVILLILLLAWLIPNGRYAVSSFSAGFRDGMEEGSREFPAVKGAKPLLSGAPRAIVGLLNLVLIGAVVGLIFKWRKYKKIYQNDERYQEIVNRTRKIIYRFVLIMIVLAYVGAVFAQFWLAKIETHWIVTWGFLTLAITVVMQYIVFKKIDKEI